MLKCSNVKHEADPDQSPTKKFIKIKLKNAVDVIFQTLINSCCYLLPSEEMKPKNMK